MLSSDARELIYFEIDRIANHCMLLFDGVVFQIIDLHVLDTFVIYVPIESKIHGRSNLIRDSSTLTIEHIGRSERCLGLKLD